jgi:DNA-binding SARP family transcriptional activator
MADKFKELLSDSNVSADQAAQWIARDCIQAIDKNEDGKDIEDELNSLWSTLLTAAEQTPHDQQDKLVEVVQSIKNFPEATEKAKKLTVWDEVKRWDELPMFGAKAREQLDIGMLKTLDSD